jgi:hypothetical protein
LLILLIGGAVLSGSACGEDEPSAPATEAERSVPAREPAGADRGKADADKADGGNAQGSGAEKGDAGDGAERHAGSPGASEEGGGGLPPRAQRLAERLTNSSGQTDLEQLSKKLGGDIPEGGEAILKGTGGTSKSPPPELCRVAPFIAGCRSAGD